METNQPFTLKCLKLEWDPLMHSVGHPTIDDQHQELVRIGNVLVELAQQGAGLDRTRLLQQVRIFHQILAWHLKFEESLLATAISEEQLEVHNKGHRKFEQFVQSIIDGYECKSDPVQCIIEILQFTNHHIFVDDFTLVDEFRALYQQTGSQHVELNSEPYRVATGSR